MRDSDRNDGAEEGGAQPSSDTRDEPLDTLIPDSVVDDFSTLVGEASAAPAIETDPSTATAARFQLRGEIARGGMGAVLRGRDTLLGRDLAIKVLLDNHLNNPDVVQRFVEEAQINGQLQHPGIVPVHEMGKLSDQRPFFAMKLVEGTTLGELLGRRESVDRERSRFIGIFEQICETVAYAHSRDVVHRDLKPANIMVGAFGEVQVMDWGLAKVLGKEPATSSAEPELPTVDFEPPVDSRPVSTTPSGIGSQTRFGAVIGTPAFMPPEQALGDIDQLDQRADVFGLGAILMVILTGNPPYTGATISDVLQLASRGSLDDAFDQLDRCGAEPELIHLAKRCLASDVNDRPRDASEVAREVTDYRESVADRLRRAELDRIELATKAEGERKRRRVVVAFAATVASFVLLAGGGWIYVQKQQTLFAQATAAAAQQEALRQEQLADAEAEATQAAIVARNRESGLRQEALVAKRNVELTLAAVYTSQGLQEARDGHNAMASLWFATAATQAESDPARQYQNHLRARNWSRDSILPVAAMHVEIAAGSVEFQPGGSLLLIGYGAHFVLWDWTADQLLPWLSGTAPITAAHWHPDGSSLAIAIPGMGVEIRRVPDGQLLHQLPHTGKITCIEFSRDGNTLAIASDKLRVWRADQEAFLPAQWDVAEPLHSMFFDRDGRRLITADTAHWANVYSLDAPQQGGPLFPPVRHKPGRLPSPPALVDNGRGLITITDSTELSYWDAESGELIRSLSTKPTWGLSHVVASPAGDKFAVGGYYGPDIWDVENLDADPIHLSHENFVDHIVFSADGSLLMSASWDTSAQLWSAADGHPIGARLNHQVGAHRVAISDDNTLLATTQDNRLVRIWQRPLDNRVLTQIKHWGERPRISHDGTLVTPGLWHASTLAGPVGRSAIEVLTSSTGDAAGPSINTLGQFRDSCICADNRSVAIVSVRDGNGWLAIHDVATGELTQEPFRFDAPPVSVASRPDATQLAIVVDDGRLIVFDVARGEINYQQQYGTASSRRPFQSSADYSPDGQKLIYHSNDDRIHVLEPTTGKPIFAPIQPLLGGRGPCRTFAFSSDSQFLATGSNGAARVWSLSDGSEQCAPLVHLADPTGLGDLCFSPDGQLLLTANADRRARVWNWREGELACPPLKHDDMIYAVAFTADGRFAVTGARGNDCGPHVWELTTGRRICRSPKPPAGTVSVYSARSLSITPDSRRLFVSTAELDSLEVIDLETLMQPPTTSIDSLRLLGEVTTSQTIEQGDSDALTIEQWHQRWLQLKASQWSYGEPDANELIRRRDLARKMSSLTMHGALGVPLADATDKLRHLKLDHQMAPLTQAIQREPDSAKAYLRRGQAYAQDGHWEPAVTDLSKAIELDPRDEFAVYQLTALFANREDLSAYHDHCEFILKRLGDTPHVVLADRAAMACLIHPDAVTDSSRVDRLVDIVEREAASHPFGSWFYRGLGLHAYRNGKFADAITACETSRQLNERQNVPILNVAAHLIEAMSHQQLGDAEAAKRSFSAAQSILANDIPKLGEAPFGTGWHDWLFAKILYREARRSGVGN